MSHPKCHRLVPLSGWILWLIKSIVICNVQDIPPIVTAPPLAHAERKILNGGADSPHCLCWIFPAVMSSDGSQEYKWLASLRDTRAACWSKNSGRHAICHHHVRPVIVVCLLSPLLSLTLCSQVPAGYGRERENRLYGVVQMRDLQCSFSTRYFMHISAKIT